jgi:hypothetical protein
MDTDNRNAHHFFSAHCFNRAWDLIEKRDRTPDEDEQMILLNQTSLWHWTQRDDCQNANMAIGYWQTSRIHAILGRAEEARRYGRLCLRYSEGGTPFLLAYAYEALARAEKVAGNSTESAAHHAEAVRLAESVEDADDRKALLDDLATIKE